MPIGVRDIKGKVIVDAIAQLPERFQTKDVSEMPMVIEAHGDLAEEYMWHAVMGRYISMNKKALGVQSQGKGAGGRGEIWQKVGA